MIFPQVILRSWVATVLLFPKGIQMSTIGCLLVDIPTLQRKLNHFSVSPGRSTGQRDLRWVTPGWYFKVQFSLCVNEGKAVCFFWVTRKTRGSQLSAAYLHSKVELSFIKWNMYAR